MDLAQIITPIITLIGGGIGIRFYDSWREARQGKMLEAQAIAKERDVLRTLKLRWKDACYATRAVALRHGVPPGELPSTPDDDPH